MAPVTLAVFVLGAVLVLAGVALRRGAALPPAGAAAAGGRAGVPASAGSGRSARRWRRSRRSSSTTRWARCPTRTWRRCAARFEAQALEAMAALEREGSSVITIEQFRELELKVGTVKSAEPHPNADRLVVLRVDLGGEERQIVAGIRAHYAPEALVGRQIVVVANLRRRRCAASRARACCWRRPAATGWCCCDPTSPSRPGRSCASAGRRSQRASGSIEVVRAERARDPRAGPEARLRRRRRCSPASTSRSRPASCRAARSQRRGQDHAAARAGDAAASERRHAASLR